LGTAPEQPHAHPAAPQNIKDAFPGFLKKFNASESGTSGGGSSKKEAATLYNEFWEAPSRYWVKNMSEDEMEAITVSAYPQFLQPLLNPCAEWRCFAILIYS
jgi:small subunit ribosomal protein YMR-31